ncbi:MAG: AAA family ATPase [Candidatus Nanoarchaeia archaeon]|nr:AAA family ATPase [Candidatus Nanoarchaeia archaeon]MDD5239489.1 AAA family ATPase [Candidatus Nanoarchaeia archaeon]
MRFIITGGPGSGKTSVVEALKKRCEGWPERYYFVTECATELIEEYQKQGIKKPTKLVEFQYKVAEQQKKKEQEIPQGVIAFLDRTMIDTMAYSDDSTLAELVINDSKKSNYAPIVFFMELSREIYRQTEIRQETFEEALELANRLRLIYKNIGYHIQDVEQDTIEHRAKDIFWTVRNYLKQKGIIK